MKVLLVHGHNRKGSTYHISYVLTDALKTATEINEICIPDTIHNGCKGCYQCIDDDTKCPVWEEKNRIMQQIEAADLLIFTTPTYCMGPCAQLKAFFDLTFTVWMSHRPKASMFHKKAVVISTCAGQGAKDATKAVSKMLFFWGIPKIYEYGLAVQAMSWDGIADQKKEKIKKDMKKLAVKLDQNTKPNPGIKTRFMFFVMRMMQKSNMGSGELERKYWEENGWLGVNRPWK